VTYYNAALTANEVSALYNARTAGKCFTYTLAYHMATNAVGRSLGYADISDAQIVVDNYDQAPDNVAWSTSCWLQGVVGLSATSIGFSNAANGGRLVFDGKANVTMVSPRHFLFSAHTHPEVAGLPAPIAFLDANNVVRWGSLVERTDVFGDIAVGILDADLPSSVGYLKVLPSNFASYLPTDSSTYVQGIGLNQTMRVFSQPIKFPYTDCVLWDSTQMIPFGLGTDWSGTITDGDSSNPERFLINNELVLVSSNNSTGGGPNYADRIDAINQAMDDLSTANSAPVYTLTTYSLTGWPPIQ
jgi:hypothetical protein